MENQTNIPTLRFPEFNGGWERKKLEIIGDYIGGGTPDTSIHGYWEGNIPWISSSDIIENDIHNINIQKYITDEAIKNSATKKIPVNSLIIVSRVGVGKFAINKSVVCTSQDFTNIIIDTKLFNANFSAFNLYKNIDILYSISQGTSIKGFTIVDLKKAELSFPTLPEQTKIAEFFTAIDKKITGLKTKKSTLQHYKKGVMQQLFCLHHDSLDLHDEHDFEGENKEKNQEKKSSQSSKSQKSRFRQEDGKPFPKWEMKKLGEVLDYEQPTNYLVSSTEYEDRFETPVVTAGKTFILGYTDETNGIFKENLPVIIFDDFTTATQFVDFHFKAKSSAMKILKAKENMNVKFIYEAMQMIDYETGGHGRHWISVYAIMDILIPTLPEQTKIANFLSSIDEKITNVELQITNAQIWKKGLLQRMFV